MVAALSAANDVPKIIRENVEFYSNSTDRFLQLQKRDFSASQT